jgi:hypothetical protein
MNSARNKSTLQNDRKKVDNEDAKISQSSSEDQNIVTNNVINFPEFIYPNDPKLNK